MNKNTRRHPREQGRKTKQKTMDDSFNTSSTYQVQKFSLNSFNRQVARKGLGRRPDPSFQRKKNRLTRPIVNKLLSGKKCSEIDLQTLGQHFQKYIEAVNLVLTEVYSSSQRAAQLGEKLESSRGQGYVVLREEYFLEWKRDNSFGQLVFERMHRNVLETAEESSIRTILGESWSMLFLHCYLVMRNSSSDFFH